ncbi:MAG: AtpZ/AtpI family protein [Clostridiales bacterium]|jgi:F0F1-type ATP synthase assembly protein I|nr:AtpZ/AtpI family protein [Clostridiales bacterium]MDR2713483.1 AtpZ/AtpI family protein [Clostridiales bacterium]
MGKKTAKWHDFFQAFFHGLAPAKKPRPASSFGFAGLAVSFGFALAARLCLAYLAGSWLDDHYQTRPYGLLIAVLIALFLSFWSLFRHFPQE